MTRTIPAIPRRPAHRGGFTIIELLMVIIIIGILAAFLLPAISGAIEDARIAEVTTEMDNMEAGVAQFNSRFGSDPPSGIVLYEQRDAAGVDPGWGADSSNAPLSEQQRRTSRSRIRQIWPDFNFNADHDFNGNGMIDSQPIYLNGAECLVFFLGGVRNATGDSVVGFAANPVNPIQNDIQAPNRISPFYKFDPGRLVDIDNDLMFEYLDTLSGQTTPMVYFSSYNGSGYTPYGIDYDPMTGSGVGTADDEILPLSFGRGPYAVYYTNDINKTDPMQRPDGTPQNPDSFQILSPGRDADYGYGGEYTSDNKLTNAQNPEGPRQPGFLELERDNITNFRGQRLGY